MSQATVYIWFRQDLRVSDNQALHAAAKMARQQQLPLKAVYIETPLQWQQHDVGTRQLDFIQRHLNCLQQSLAALGVELELWHCDDFNGVQQLWQSRMQQHDIAAIFAGREPELNELRRDQALIEAGLPLNLTDEHCILAPGTVVNQNGEMYRVFTPFFKRWREIASAQQFQPVKAPVPLGPALSVAEPISFSVATGDSELWRAGEGEAKQLLQQFVANHAADYKQQRDFPALDGTSSLSPYLAIGVISPRQCLATLLAQFPEALVDDTSPGRCWLSELVWREFYRHLLQAYPNLSMGANFNPLGAQIAWRDDQQAFDAWCEGRTGYPIVDAAMRQLNRTGWMHNRLRMITASFLTKHLLIDWHRGERWFRRQLLDGDLAANNGGWQWSAGTGCDAQPYFRIFNPMTQSEKFDPDASFIRKYVPEVRDWPLKQIHHPESRVNGHLFAVSDYPTPIVDHSAARERALDRLSVLKKAN
ncbi:deoxyribodipyrimidine photo-lyase [Shewanella avicenniae]|uniref:Deoxyribodipyrimidine photo-lyase n=1 Tax=Shewanella avicenniae TaxID=2814294 RepID=A0ABX7QVA5_9GAMM|nr:deoxyribodipyrimidine photo-lyase [Shewanella avicenniae]QSX34568.1 deoxyribodipyrimidine photo-lyase [Shewanella avicenniae]